MLQNLCDCSQMVGVHSDILHRRKMQHIKEMGGDLLRRTQNSKL